MIGILPKLAVSVSPMPVCSGFQWDALGLGGCVRRLAVLLEYGVEVFGIGLVADLRDSARDCRTCHTSVETEINAS